MGRRVKIIGKVMARGDDIVIAEYDPNWPQRYRLERSHVLEALGGLLVDVEHFGSTSVPGLSAKPIIDIMASVRGLPLADVHVAALGQLGFESREDNEPWWLFFSKGTQRTHHLHILDVNHDSARDNWEQQVLFRDYLRPPGIDCML